MQSSENEKMSFLSFLKNKIQKNCGFYDKIISFTKKITEQKEEPLQGTSPTAQINQYDDYICSPRQNQYFLQNADLGFQIGPSIKLEQLQKPLPDQCDIQFKEYSRQMKRHRRYRKQKKTKEVHIAIIEVQKQFLDFNDQFENTFTPELIKISKSIFEQIYDILTMKMNEMELKNRKNLCLIGFEILYKSALCSKKCGQYNEAIGALIKIMSIFEINDADTIAKIQIEIAELYFDLYLFNKSLNYFQKSLIIYEQLNWKIEIGLILNQMAIIFGLKNQFETTFHLIRSQVGRKDILIAECYDTIGIAFYLNNQFEHAEHNLLLASSIKQEFKDQYHLSKARTHNILGLIYYLGKFSAKAIDQFKIALLELKQDNSLYQMIQIYNNIALAFWSLGQLDSGKKYLQNALSIGNSLLTDEHYLINKIKRNLKLMNHHS